MLTSSRAANILLILVLAVGLAIVAMLASGVRGGPLDPPGSPASTDGVHEPGTAISSLPHTITQPGRYYFTRNLAGSGSGDAIVIDADNVTLDLNGFTLSRTDFVWTGIIVANTHKGVVVRNGTVTGFGGGLTLSNASESRIEHITARNNQGGSGMSIGSDSVIEDCIVTHNQSGIVLGSNSVLTRCTVTNNAGNGVYALEAAVVEDNEIAMNAVGIGGYAGVVAGGDSVLVKDNNLYSNGAGDGGDVILTVGVNVAVIDNVSRRCNFVSGVTLHSIVPPSSNPHGNEIIPENGFC